MEKNLKILVVDDAVTYRQILSKILSGFEDVELVGTASNGKIALSKIESKQPDLILLDVVMPEMDGLETLEQIRKRYSHIDVIMISGMDQENANHTFKALSAGALDFIPKSHGTSADKSMMELKNTLSRLIQMSKTRKYSRQARGLSSVQVSDLNPQRKPTITPDPYKPVEKLLIQVSDMNRQRPEIPLYKPFFIPSVPPDEKNLSAEIKQYPRKKADRIDVVVIGVSTGGPNALQEIIPKIEKDFPVPILAVQHMPPMFTASLAARLNNISEIKVVEGEDKQIIEKGIMYIAPGGRHMVVRKDKYYSVSIGLTDSPPVNSCRPSVDVLLRSVAMTYGGNVLTVILTGMGNDGVAGVAAIRRKGGYSIVQDEKTSLIWGMPGAVVAANQADGISPIDRMASKIMDIVRKGYFYA